MVDPVKVEVATIMADGRWRTVGDFGYHIQASQQKIRQVLRWMHKLGLIERDMQDRCRVAAYRKSR